MGRGNVGDGRKPRLPLSGWTCPTCDYSYPTVIFTRTIIVRTESWNDRASAWGCPTTHTRFRVPRNAGLCMPRPGSGGAMSRRRLKRRGLIVADSCSCVMRRWGASGDGREGGDGFAGGSEPVGVGSPVAHRAPPLHAADGVFDGHSDR